MYLDGSGIVTSGQTRTWNGLKTCIYLVATQRDILRPRGDNKYAQGGMATVRRSQKGGCRRRDGTLGMEKRERERTKGGADNFL